MGCQSQQTYDYEALKEYLIDKVHLVYKTFIQKLGNPPSCYVQLDNHEMALAIHNAVGDIRRSTEHHSKKDSSQYGPSDIKIAAFLGKWVGRQKPFSG